MKCIKAAEIPSRCHVPTANFVPIQIQLPRKLFLEASRNLLLVLLALASAIILILNPITF
jgi:hypothetical protein